MPVVAEAAAEGVCLGLAESISVTDDFCGVLDGVDDVALRSAGLEQPTPMISQTPTEPRKLGPTRRCVRSGLMALSFRAGLGMLGLAVVAFTLEANADTVRGYSTGAKTASAHGSRKARKRTHTKGKRRAATAPRSSRRGQPVHPALRAPTTTPLAPSHVAIRCAPDMVAVAGRVCVDRFEMSLHDATTGAPWSPYYAPRIDDVSTVAGFYRDLRARSSPGSLDAMLDIPEPPAFRIRPAAVSSQGVVPQGYLTANEAAQACGASGKRLCSEAEWVTACRGEAQRDFPYGDHYERGACNVYRESHPSFLLHGNAARYHDDPRNNLVSFEGRPLLRETGASDRCASQWGDDAIYDMVGNLDEWVADGDGAFLGGFYSRGTESGCYSKVSAHPRTYSDYSTGSRCCADPIP